MVSKSSERVGDSGQIFAVKPLGFDAADITYPPPDPQSWGSFAEMFPTKLGG